MHDAPNGGARWPERLRDLCLALQSGPRSGARQEVRCEIWTILSHSLQRYIDAQNSPGACLTTEEIEDLASEKSLDLIGRLESGRWDLRDRTGPEIAGFLSATAHNLVVDLLRRPARRSRSAEAPPEAVAEGASEERLVPDTPDSLVERREFIEALRECAEDLQPRGRRIWFFRVFYGLTAKEIAAHPKVALQPGRVDELLFSVRQFIRRCMERKGQRLRELPPGTFFEIWKSFRGSQPEEVGANGQAVDAAP